MVPLIMILVYKDPFPARVWLSAVLASFGALLLSTGKISLSLQWGDSLELAGALFWSLHVILIGIASKDIHPLPFTFMQLIIAGSIHTILGFIFERNTFSGFSESMIPIFYTGVFSIGLGYSLQAYGQSHAPSIDASFILSLEAVFAAIFGLLFLKEVLTYSQWIGCLIIFLAIILSQFRERKQEDPVKDAILDL